MSDFDDSWSVRLASGEVRVMNLDQLDAAFDAGVINETTLVLHSAATAWNTLGHLAGIEAVPHSAGPSSVAPLAHDVFDDVTEPMEMDFRPRTRGVVVGIVAAVMILGGLAFAVTRFGGETLRASGSSGHTAVTLPVAPTAPPPLPDVGIPEPAGGVGGASNVRPPDVGMLSEDQKRALMEADRLREAQRKPKTRAPSAAPRHRAKTSSPFHTGGNVHDPLNSGP